MEYILLKHRNFSYLTQLILLYIFIYLNKNNFKIL